MVEFKVWFARELRRRGISQEAAARELGVSVSTIRRWLDGRTDPRYTEMWTITRIWGVHPFPKTIRPR
jgi:transcriptional regulator with XRE-family HTH domain